MKFLIVSLLLSGLDTGFGFGTPRLPTTDWKPPVAAIATGSHCALDVKGALCSSRSASALFLSASGGDRRSSRLEGNMRPPTAEELEIMDEMILKLADAKPYELPNAVRRAFRCVRRIYFFVMSNAWLFFSLAYTICNDLLRTLWRSELFQVHNSFCA